MGSSSETDTSVIDFGEMQTIKLLDKLTTFPLPDDLLGEILVGLKSLLTNTDNNGKGRILDLLIELGENAKQDKQKASNDARKAKKSDVQEKSQENIQSRVKPEDLIKEQSRYEWKESMSAIESRIKQLEQLLQDLLDNQAMCKENTRQQNEVKFPPGKKEDILQYFLDNKRALEDIREDLFKNCQYLHQQMQRIIEEISKAFHIMMEKWRRYEALMHAKITSCGDREEDIIGLNAIFSRVFKMTPLELGEERERRLTERSNSHLATLKSNISQICWCYEQQPSPCVKFDSSTKKVEELNIKLRLLGMSKNDVSTQDIYYFWEKDYKQHHKCVIKSEEQEETANGLILFVTLQLSEFQRSQKRSCGAEFLHFNRISWQIQLNGSNAQIQCLSLPFTARTGSTQLWCYTGAVHWYIWVEPNLYKDQCHCASSMKVEHFLSMLQARYHTITRQAFTPQNIAALEAMLDSLHTGETVKMVKMNKILQDKLPNQRNPQKKRNFSFYTWYLSACNTLERFREDQMLGALQSFLSFQQCNEMLKNQPVGSTLVRISQSEVTNEQSETPMANVTVHFASDSEILTTVRSPDKIDTLYNLLTHLHAKENGQTLSVYQLIPNEILLEDFKTLSIEKSSDRNVNVNGYGHKACDKQGDIVLIGESSDSDDCQSELPFEMVDCVGFMDLLPSTPYGAQ